MMFKDLTPAKKQAICEVLKSRGWTSDNFDTLDQYLVHETTNQDLMLERPGQHYIGIKREELKND